MAQSGYTPIQLYYSTTAAAVPLAANLAQGELAINITDGKLYYENNSGVVTLLASAAGSLGDVVGPASATANGIALFDGTTGKLLKNSSAQDGLIYGLTVGRGNGAVATNVALGAGALQSSNSGNGNNIAIGYEAGRSNTTGAYNTWVGGLDYSGGLAVGRNNTTGQYNAGFGAGALANNTTASNNTAVGYQAAYANTTGNENLAVGSQALVANTTGSANTAIGKFALGTNTTGTRLTAVGTGAGAAGNYSSFVGYLSGNANTGDSNTGVGDSALKVHTSGVANTAMGQSAMSSSTTAASNAAFGVSALGALTTGSFNVAVGRDALLANTTASNSTAVGYQAGYNSNASSGNNVFIGYQAGTNSTTGNQVIMIGAGSQPSAAGAGNELVIGTLNVTGKGGSTGFISPNGGGVYQGNNSATWSITSDQRLKKNIVDNNIGLSAINAIKVRNFEYRTVDEITDLPKLNAIAITGVQLGVIAQELQAVLPDCVKTESTGVMSVQSDNLTWYMINAIKELKADFDAYKASHP